MSESVDKLVAEFEKLVSTLRGMAEKGKESGQSSLARAVDTQVGILGNAIHRSMVDCGALEYAKQYGSMKPTQVAEVLRRIASAIDNSRNPQRRLVVEDIRRVIAVIK
jgi:hypothetical protein